MNAGVRGGNVRDIKRYCAARRLAVERRLGAQGVKDNVAGTRAVVPRIPLRSASPLVMILRSATSAQSAGSTVALRRFGKIAEPTEFFVALFQQLIDRDFKEALQI